MSELIYICGRDFIRYSGGSESYSQAHCMAAHQAGFSPRLFALGRATEEIDVGYARVNRVRAFGGSYRTEFASLYAPFFVPALVRHLKATPGPHLIHSFGNWAILGMLATKVLRRMGVDVVHVSTCYEFLQPHTKAKLSNAVVRAHRLRFARQFAVYVWVIVFEERAEVWSWRESDAFVVNYDRLIKIMDDQHGGAKGVVAKLPYASITAFDEAAVHELPEALEAIADLPGPLLVSTSRHAPRKGVDAFIRVLARLRDEGVDFRAALVGPGELLELHRELVRDLDLGDRVILPGRVPEVSPYLQHADVFVFPSIAEGSGSMSVIEALQFGVPVVSCSVDGMVEDLTDGEDAVMVETGSVDDLHRGLKQLIDDSELRARIAAGGRELYARRFSAEAMTDALSGLYAELGLEPVRAD